MSEPSDSVEPQPTPEPAPALGPEIETESGGEVAADTRFQRFDLRTQRDEAMAAAEAAVRAGRAIVLPTDTVYGIGADAFSAEAVAALLDAKRRGRDMPPPVLIAEPAMLPALVSYVPMYAEELAKRFWPGALTLILTAQSALRMDLGETGGTIAVRVPDNQDARDLLRHTGPLAVSSANVTGSAPATSVEEAIQQLGDSVAVYLDGGPTPGNIPSTIVDFSVHGTGRLVRRGVIGFEELHELAPYLEDLPESAAQPEETTQPADEFADVPLAEEPSEPSHPSAKDTGAPDDIAMASGDDGGSDHSSLPSQSDAGASGATPGQEGPTGSADPENPVGGEGPGADPRTAQG